MSRRRSTVLVATAVGAAAAVALLPAAVAQAGSRGHSRAGSGSDRHVLLLSVDGLHQADLARYVEARPSSALAALVRRGTSFTSARSPLPSDSFPGMVAQVTGGSPRTTGVYYDDSYDRALLPAGTTSCPGTRPGADVTYAEDLDRDPLALDAGQGLPGLPGSILQMTGEPVSLLDPARLPVDPSTCRPVYPHSYLRVNTVFEVLEQHGLRTAWSDKHAAYDVLQGRSGTGISDLFTPEINSTADADGNDWTAVNSLTQQFDGYRAQAVRNEIDGFDHSRRRRVGTPALYGMNFQSVSTAQKLASSGGQPGGYAADGSPGPVLGAALDEVDRQVGTFVAELRATSQLSGTTIVLSAKHGQSPVEPSALTRIPDAPVLAGLDAAWRAAGHAGPDLVAKATDDDAVVLWLSEHTQAAADFARSYLLGHDGTGNDVTGAPKGYAHSGLATVYAGRAAADFFGTSVSDSRVPDLYGVAQHGVVFTGGTKKIAEHGGADPQDRDVPLVVAGPDVRPGRSDASVETTQIAPTVLRLLGQDPRQLQAVRAEGTRSLPVGRGADDEPAG